MNGSLTEERGTCRARIWFHSAWDRRQRREFEVPAFGNAGNAGQEFEHRLRCVTRRQIHFGKDVYFVGGSMEIRPSS